ncbi:MAG: hypothetical protein ABFS42_01235 [Candidatus Krumholzibacteriota bacterium]
MTTKTSYRRLYLPLLLACLLPAAGCEKNEPPLTLEDLSAGEFVFVERMVILERAKTVALLDRAAGDALLDSLAAAWGDSSLDLTLTGAPDEPLRSEAVAALLRRVLAAEQDSLRASSGFERLTRPLPDPVPLAPEPNPADGDGAGTGN